ncbi:MAG: hypothetical protein LBL79_09650 [Prevotella sp.]|jgi:hypothetical protein|nr:hypothetical protein [Prevotella sp.]
MKTKFILILAISLSGIFYSCEKEEFEKSKDYEYVSVDNNIIAGVWYHSYEIDSLVLVFEENRMKEYRFLKATKELLSYKDLGNYWLSKWIYNNGKIENTISLSGVDSTSTYSTFTDYKLSNNILTIYRKDYTKIELYKAK